MDASSAQSFVQVLYNDLKSVINYLWTKERKLKIVDGLLSREALCELGNRLKRNLKYELRLFYLEFLKRRSKAGANEYQRAVSDFVAGFDVKKNEVCEETLKDFGISKDVFQESCEKWSNDLRVVRVLRKIQNIVIKSESVGPGLDQLSTIVFTQEYIGKMQERLAVESQNTTRFRILDELRLKYGITELDLYLAFHLHRQHPAISQMRSMVLELESKFDKPIPSNPPGYQSY